MEGWKGEITLPKQGGGGQEGSQGKLEAVLRGVPWVTEHLSQRPCADESENLDSTESQQHPRESAMTTATVAPISQDS